MEKKVKIATTDGYIIRGVLNYKSPRPKKLVIFVHGLASHRNEHYFYNAAVRFPKQNLAVFRFDLYSGGKGGRALKHCTIKTHAIDLNQVIKHFQKQFKKIYVVGHSLGGPAVLLADTALMSGIVLWDPSYALHTKWFLSLCKWNKKLGTYTIPWGTEIILDKRMYEEWKHFPPGEKLVKKVHVPIKFIFAGAGGQHSLLAHGSAGYYTAANKPKAMTIIKNAAHSFDEEGAEEQLHKETIAWFKKY